MRTGFWIGLISGLVVAGVWLADRLAGPAASNSIVLAILVLEGVIAGLIYLAVHRACVEFGTICTTLTFRGEDTDADTGTADLLGEGPPVYVASDRLGWHDPRHLSSLHDDQRRRLADGRRAATDRAIHHAIRHGADARTPTARHHVSAPPLSLTATNQKGAA